MSRFTQYDSDSERLPEGMTRVGYDADTQRYSYQDADGHYWEGPAGSRYGQLRRVDDGPEPSDAQTQPFLSSTDEHITRDKQEARRYMLPFFLICGVFLLAVIWLLGRPSSDSEPAPAPVVCSDHSVSYIVKSGESCWAIAEKYGANVEVLKRDNPGLDCDTMQPGQEICVPIAS